MLPKNLNLVIALLFSNRSGHWIIVAVMLHNCKCTFCPVTNSAFTVTCVVRSDK